MPNKPSTRSKPGANLTAFKKGCLIALPILLLGLGPVLPGQAGAAAAPLRHELTVGFDLERATLRGVSSIDFPAGIGDSYHMPGLTIEEIRINGQILDLNDPSQPYLADPLHELTIEPATETRRVVITYRLTPVEGESPVSDLIGPGGISLTGLWHPILHQETRFQLNAKIPAGFEAISEAEEITSITGADETMVNFTFNHPLPAINLIAGPFVVEKTTVNPDLDLYTYFFDEDRELAAGYRDQARAYLKRYEELLGPFPFRRFSVVENRLPTGYSMPTFTVLGQSVVRLPFITTTSLGHEIVHQWFGNAIRPAANEGNWSEGLTTLLADMQYEAEQGRGPEYRKTQLNKYQSYVHDDNQMSLAQFAGARSHLLSGHEASRAIGYTKAAMVFHMLRQRLGEEKFIKSLRNFYSRLAYQQAGWEDLRASFEQVACEDLSDFFTQWLTRTDLPGLAVSKLDLVEEEGRPVLSFVIRQNNPGEPYNLTLPVLVHTDTTSVVREITLEQDETKVEIPLPSQPRELVLDENYHLMRKLAPAEQMPVWDRFRGAAVKVAVLDPNLGEELFAPLLELLTAEGVKILADAEVKDSDLSTGAVIFLGSGSKSARRLFAAPGHPATGFTLEVRNNPLNAAATAVLVSSADRNEVRLAARKLQHYGKYSYLHFQGGRMIDKRISGTDNGQRFSLDPPPGGVEVTARRSFDGIIEQLRDHRVIYIGESHTRYEDHLLQLRVIRALYHQKPNLAIGMEMFNLTNQPTLDRYVLEHSIDEAEFLRQSHYFSNWSYDYRFYRPIINFARANRIPVIALNLPKETVSEIYQGQGLDGLTDEQQDLIPPDRDLGLSGYRERIGTFFRMHRQTPDQPNKFNDFLQAQAVWDETMAASVAAYLQANPGQRMVVVAGKGHVEKENGIPPRVARRLEVEQSVILNAEIREITGDTADFVLFTPPAELPPAAMMGVVLKQDGDRVLVDKLSPHGMAGKAGLKEGDIFLTLDDQPIKTIEELKVIMFFKKHGSDRVKARIKRPRKIFRDEELEFEIPL